MDITSEDLAAGRTAYARVKSYGLQRNGRLAIYLIPGIWLMSSVVHCEAKPTSWNYFQLIFWSLILILIIIFQIKRKREYEHDLTVLTQLRTRYGEETSFEIKDAESDSVSNANDSTIGVNRLTGRGFKPLIEFGILLTVCFGLKLLIDLVWPLLK